MMVKLRLPENFIETLPDPPGARRFIQQLYQKYPDVAQRTAQKPPLLANVLVLAAYSPFLAEAMLRRPEYIEWLGHERDLDRVKSEEELFEDLARFAAIHSDLSEAMILSGFKQREWLRIYLRDCLRLATLSEITLELSNLADVLLQHALWHAYQPLVNQYGTPEATDAQGRIQRAEFAIVALGKLGSRELNYASDIDLLYLYSQNGGTSTGQLSNKEFFVKLAERITDIVGGVGEEGAVYRIDLRLRPHGRVGDLAVSLDEAIQYYRRVAQPWERQALIRAGRAAGDDLLVQRFLTAIRDDIYPPEPLPELVEEIRAIKDKIDCETGRTGRGINVKLGKGGIREIEFIVQALQLYFGGREPWVRGGQILIGLQRLADKGIISDADRARLSEAYTFLRTVEHRLQMDHGARTHTVITDAERLNLLARRLGSTADDQPGEAFLSDLHRHLQHVETMFESLFRRGQRERARRLAPPRDEQEWKRAQLDAALEQLATAFSAPPESPATLSLLVSAALAKTLNPDRAMKNLTAFAQSLTHALMEDRQSAVQDRFMSQAFLDTLEKLIRFFGLSQFFSQILISHPRLVSRLARTASECVMQTPQDYLERLRAAMSERPAELSLRMDALRRQWHEELLQIGYLDVTDIASLQQTNLQQTALARASLHVACELALQQLQAKFGPLVIELRYVILGLGRLGHNGMDYGSDLDLLVVYDDAPGSPLARFIAEEVYTALVEQVVHILSAITREGFLYSIDLRLRPDGASGSLAHSRAAFLEYVRSRAATWEHLAYLKAYPVVGEREFATAVYRELQTCILQAHHSRPGELAREVREMRQRLEREKARGTASRNIKYGVGGMLDVYFATRYLQLKHQIPEPPERGTLPLIDHLLARGVIDETQHRRLFDGYAFLRLTDHCLRLLFDRPRPVVPSNQQHLRHLARLFGSASVEAWQKEYQLHTGNIRHVYEQVVDSGS
jgi:glutamate-ammonia-ligase adenylyltransferase